MIPRIAKFLAACALGAATYACGDPIAPDPDLQLFGAAWLWASDAEIVYTSGFAEGERFIRARNYATGNDRLLVGSLPDATLERNAIAVAGQHLYFLATGRETGVPDLYRVELSGSAPPQLVTRNVAYDAGSSFVFAASPAGDLVAVRTAELLLASVATGQSTTVSAPRGWRPEAMAWSTDGGRLLVAANTLFSVLDVATSEWSSWDAQSTTGGATDILLGTTLRWENGTPVGYAVRATDTGVVASRYDIAAAQRTDVGMVHPRIDAGMQGGYVWAPDLSRVAWTHSVCVRSVAMDGGSLCAESRFELRVTTLQSGQDTAVVVEKREQWPTTGTAAFSPTGSRLAWDLFVLRVYDM